MTLDPAFVGRSFPPTSRYGVSRAKIVEFADSIGDKNPLYRDPEAARAAGYPDVIAPPTFLTVINVPAIERLAADPELGLDYSRMVHGDQTFSFARPVYAGDQLAITTYVEDVFTRVGNDFLGIRGEIVDIDDELVCTTRAQLVVRGGDA